jgi:hypothetical protein
VLFYVACRDLLRPFRPLPKFILIKSVVFLTYWQGVVIFLFSEGGAIKTPEEAADYQNVLICVEMLIAAFAHLYAFPYKDYAEANIGGSKSGFWNSVFHALNFTDVVHDTMHQFAPTYHEYILYSDGNEVEPQRYRARTFVHTGQELESIPKIKNPYLADKLGNSLYSADAPSEISSSATVNMDSRGKLSVGDPSLQEAGLSHPNDPSLMEPTAAGHQIVDVELPPGTVRPAQ